jgi:catechol 2,3-dioxygenase-like lactoylglutathione lyase family enzyme
MKPFDELMNQYDRGAINRRQLLQGLAMLAVAPAAAVAQSAPVDPLRARTINHVHIVVNNYEESRTFYEKLLGARFQHEFAPTIHSVVLPGSETNGAWLSLDHGTSQTDAEKKNRLGHFAVGIERFNADECRATIEKNLPGVKVQVAGDKRSCFVYDPNGIRVQLMAKEDKGAQ